MMGDKNLRVPGTPGTTIRFPSCKNMETREEIMMGDKNLRVPGTPGSTIRFPSYRSYKNGDKRRL